MNSVDRIRAVGIIPVVRASSSDEALAAVEAIRAGGIPILEITLTVPGALEVIADLTRRLGDDALIGAGTVLDADAARACVDAGARFVVSPALDISVASRGQESGCSGDGLAPHPEQSPS